MNLSMRQNKSGLAREQRKGWREPAVVPIAGGVSGWRRSGRAQRKWWRRAVPAPQTEGVPPAKPSSPGPPSHSLLSGGWQQPGGGKESDICDAPPKSHQTQFHLLSQDTPPFPLVSQHLTWSHHSEMSSLTRSFLPLNSTHTCLD